ncbi:hypothetical protein QV09_05615 [Gallibacterium salpingitidis]|uniref:Uncharacterized protein n=1 Tax=Gallibacterium salpingitidis TaxID=505341 RepID=A0AB36E2F6_9PAST|nr:hypothetical protein [Gallibacterium salpingitidis]OBX10423.1 hypothetical protein QV09_05615 [Gallibacterium salpingitidis]
MPIPWSFTYPIVLSSNLLYADVIRYGGAGAFSEIIQYRGLSYFTWIDKDCSNKTGGGDIVGVIVVGV